MGDVVLTVPVIRNLLRSYPELQITILTRPFFQTFFENMPQVRCFPVDLKGRHHGFFGLKKLVDDIVKEQKIDLVLDLHSVMRTWTIGWFFRMKGIPVYKINKGRRQKRQLIEKGIASFNTEKHQLPLPHTSERYHAVFANTGLEFDMEPAYLSVFQSVAKPKNKLAIGIAPFAAHASKQWGIDKIYELIEKLLLQYPKLEIYLFGGGKMEVETLQLMAAYYPNVHNLAGKMSLKEEIQKISELQAFISMDSGNMHIATLTGIPVLSIWGGTHPDVGFSALYQPKENDIQLSIEQMPCRPCSVFGTAHCTHVKPFACMLDLGVDEVIKRLTVILR